MIFIAGAVFACLFALIAIFWSWFSFMERFPFSFIFFLVTPFDNLFDWFFTFDFTNCVAFSDTFCFSFFLMGFAPFVIGTFTFLTITSLFVAILIVRVM